MYYICSSCYISIGQCSSRDIGIGYRLGEGILIVQSRKAAGAVVVSLLGNEADKIQFTTDLLEGKRNKQGKRPPRYHKSRLEVISFVSLFPCPALFLLSSTFLTLPSPLSSSLPPFFPNFFFF